MRDIKVRYKRSILGVTWTMLGPLLNMLTLTIVFSALLKTSISNYPVYFMTGFLFWNFFSQSTSAAAMQTQDANAIAKAYVRPAVGLRRGGGRRRARQPRCCRSCRCSASSR